jgi:hypothetical protein
MLKIGPVLQRIASTTGNTDRLEFLRYIISFLE